MKPPAISAAGAGRTSGAHPLLGFGNLARKDILEWLATRRAVGTLVVTTALTALATVTPWLSRQRGTAVVRSFDATTAFLAAGWLQLVPLIAVFATMALVVGERDRGTLGWSLSKPLSRGAFLASKLVTGTGLFALFGIALPMLVSGAIATATYGSLPDLAQAGWEAIGCLALSCLFITLNVTISTFGASQSVVATAAIVVLFGSQILGTLAPELAGSLPTSVGTWIVAAARGSAPSIAAPATYLLTLAALLLVARSLFERSEL